MYKRAQVFKISSTLPGSPPYKNIQNAFQATKGNSVNSFIFVFSTIAIFWKKKLIIQMISAYDYRHLVTTTLSHLTFLKP